MTVETLQVENIKCGGCMRTIKDAVLSLPQVSEVEINRETGEVTVTFEPTTTSLATISKKLAAMGYPPQGANTLGNKAISYMSCMIGRVKGAEE